jgi:hypothetical protein
MNTIEVTKEKHNKADFARLRSVLACASHDPARYVISKVKVEKHEEGITIIATDGRRLRCDRFDMEAEPGLYDIKVNTARTVFLTMCKEELVFPNHRQVIPRHGKDDAYALQGTGGSFVQWATSALGCYLDPALIELGEDEEVTLYIQKHDPCLSPALLVNDTTTLVIMPIRMDSEWVGQIEEIRLEMARKIIEQEQEQQEAIAA